MSIDSWSSWCGPSEIITTYLLFLSTCLLFVIIITLQLYAALLGRHWECSIASLRPSPSPLLFFLHLSFRFPPFCRGFVLLNLTRIPFLNRIANASIHKK